MSSTLSTLKEWINPNWGRHRIVPPMETGLRPNVRLDEGDELLTTGEYTPDSVLVTDENVVVFSSDDQVLRMGVGRTVERLARFNGRVSALALRGAYLLAAIEGLGLVQISSSGEVRHLCTDTTVNTCVTDLAVTADGTALVTVGSTALPKAQWSQALLTTDRSGLIVKVDGPRAQVVADKLPWPAGIAVTADGHVLISMNLEYRIEMRPLDALGRPGRTMVSNLPVYPGRVCVGEDGYWFAAPFIRNRVTEMLLDEPKVLAEMISSIKPDEWFVPRLQATNPFTDAMQMGQLRVHGVIKSWAPARSCGLAFRVDSSGRVVESVHARVDSARHGVTGVAVLNGELIAAVRGYGNLLYVKNS
jgi:hypothetical protein